MKKFVFALLVAGGFLLLSVGCVRTVDGHMRPGVPFTSDTVENRYDVSVNKVFAAAKKVLQFRGNLYSENTIAKTLEAKVDTRTVRVAVDEVEPKVTRVRVQVRTKGGRGDIQLANQIAVEIAVNLR